MSDLIQNPRKKSSLPDLALIFFSSLFVYLLTIYPTVGTEDSGELIVSAANLDIAHPSGYPLHTLLGWLFSKIIFFGDVGWRVNVMSAFFAAGTITILYFTLKRLLKNDIIAFCFSLFFAFTDIFWSQAIRAEVYSLNIFLLALITYLLLLWSQTDKRKYLYLTALTFGLSLCNHHMMMLAAPPILIFIIINKWRVITNAKTVLICLLLLLAGLIPYAYLPIRTAIAPYDNPAYIKHEGLYTWDKFTAFVGRNIYGGTISIPTSSENEEKEIAQPPAVISFFEKIGATIARYTTQMATNNASGFIKMIYEIFRQLLFIPLLFFIPGIYYLCKKSKKYAVFIFSLFVFYTTVQLTFIAVGGNLHPFTIFSNRPFYIPAIFITAIISAAGIQFCYDLIKNTVLKMPAMLIIIALVIPPLAINFTSENESGNYIAHDFSLNLLNSLPQNSYMLSTGKDNLTFPLYYLSKIEKIRPDTEVEIYYGKKCVDNKILDDKLKKTGKSVVFIDLLPCGYNAVNLVPYNFVYAYGDTSTLPPANTDQPTIKGIRDKMDYPNSKLKGLYYLKLAYAYAYNHPENSSETYNYFDKVRQEIPENEQFKNFINDYLQGKDDTGMF
jgi:4-amino-4-deoxy-L-arabinose transferase-like glycosyltransferase